MSKKTLLSALLISSFGFSNAFAAATADVAQTGGTEATAMKFIANSKTPEAPTKKALGISDQDCPTFPFSRTTENNAEQIIIKNVTLGAVDPWFFQGNPALKEISFAGSTVDLSIFEGHTFAAGCSSIETVSFKSTNGVTLDEFIRKYASKTLLERILARQCKLIFCPENEGVTMLHFITKDKIPVVTQDAVHLVIKTSKILEQIAAEEKAAAATPARGWVNTLTFGFLGK